MNRTEITERLKAVIKQERAFYQLPDLRISDEEAAEKLEIKIGEIVHVGLHLLGGTSKEHHELKTFAYGEDQLTFDEILKEPS